MKRSIYFILAVILIYLFWLNVPYVMAEVVVFRMPLDEFYSGTNIRKGECFPMTLSENLSAKIKGQVGANCTFDVDIKPLGEWVLTGGYFDTPPYVFGNDKFYDVNPGSFSFTCNSSAFSLDRASLPSYARITDEQEITGTLNEGPIKRYTVKLNQSAPDKSSFNMNFNFSANCNMKEESGIGGGIMSPVDPLESSPDKCGRANVIEINPREISLKLPVKLTSSCLPPTDIPEPTPSDSPPPACGDSCDGDVDICPNECPICEINEFEEGVCIAPSPTSGEPTSTPEPTDTPTPTITPTPMPVCGSTCLAGTDTCPLECPVCVSSTTASTTVCSQQASCNCDGFEYTGTIASGNTVSFTTFAKVENPDTNNAEVRYVNFHVEQDGTEIVDSGQINVGAAQRTTDQSGVPIDRYSSNWDYTLPQSTGAGGNTTYRVYAKITCGYQSQSAATGQSASPPEKNIFDRIIDFFLRILGVDRTQAAGDRIPTVIDPIYEATQPSNWMSPPSPTPEQQETIKLGTFDPFTSPTPTPFIELGCKQIIFSIPK